MAAERDRKQPDTNQAESNNDAANLNLSDAELRRNRLKTLIVLGKERGYLTYAEINDHLPEELTADADQIEAARAKSEDVKNQIDQGLDFSAAAIRFSDAQNALDGGKLGWRSADKLPEAFAERAATMEKGEVSVPMRGPAGFHIIKLVDRRALGTELVTEFHARHILIKQSELVSSDQAKAQATALRQRAVAGEDFGKLAKEFSQDTTTANLSGDMGWFQKEGYGTRVAQEVGNLKTDQISEPFQTELGWHVMQLLGERQSDRSDEVQRAQARQALIARKADEEYQSYLRQMRAEAYVEVRLPGGAAP